MEAILIDEFLTLLSVIGIGLLFSSLKEFIMLAILKSLVSEVIVAIEVSLPRLLELPLLLLDDVDDWLLLLERPLRSFLCCRLLQFAACLVLETNVTSSFENEEKRIRG